MPVYSIKPKHINDEITEHEPKKLEQNSTKVISENFKPEEELEKANDKESDNKLKNKFKGDSIEFYQAKKGKNLIKTESKSNIGENVTF